MYHDTFLRKTRGNSKLYLFDHFVKLFAKPPQKKKSYNWQSAICGKR